ncbi:unnamed protein product [Peniophora sp. CBMAI 1063]|nr:unnamed protein product [Peniophora sp. CBMAI 1063]
MRSRGVLGFLLPPPSSVANIATLSMDAYFRCASRSRQCECSFLSGQHRRGLLQDVDVPYYEEVVRGHIHPATLLVDQQPPPSPDLTRALPPHKSVPQFQLINPGTASSCNVSSAPTPFSVIVERSPSPALTTASHVSDQELQAGVAIIDSTRSRATSFGSVTPVSTQAPTLPPLIFQPSIERVAYECLASLSPPPVPPSGIEDRRDTSCAIDNTELPIAAKRANAYPSATAVNTDNTRAPSTDRTEFLNTPFTATHEADVIAYPEPVHRNPARRRAASKVHVRLQPSATSQANV